MKTTQKKGAARVAWNEEEIKAVIVFPALLAVSSYLGLAA